MKTEENSTHDNEKNVSAACKTRVLCGKWIFLLLISSEFFDDVSLSIHVTCE